MKCVCLNYTIRSLLCFTHSFIYSSTLISHPFCLFCCCAVLLLRMALFSPYTLTAHGGVSYAATQRIQHTSFSSFKSQMTSLSYRPWDKGDSSHYGDNF